MENIAPGTNRNPRRTSARVRTYLDNAAAIIMASAAAVALLEIPASQSLPCYAVLALVVITQLLTWKDRRRRRRRLSELKAEIAALPSGHPDRGFLDRLYQKLKAVDARPGDPEYEPVFDLRPAITRPAQEIPRRDERGLKR